LRRALALALAFGSAALASAAYADAVPADAVLAELPFLDAPEDAAGIRIDIGRPGEKSLSLQLDTGSPESFATPVAARDMGISVRRSKQTPYRRATRLGRDVELFVDTRHSSESAAAEGGEWAILGGRFLASFVVEIDGPGRKVRFLDPERFTVPERVDGADEQVLPFKLATNRPIIEVEVGDAHVASVLSTGAFGTLLLPGGFAADAKVVPDPAATETLEPMPGAGKLDAATAPSVRIGRFEEKDVPILVAEKGAQGAGPRSEAILGLDLLHGYVLRIDYPRRRLWMARPAAAPEPAK
jgi:hypothetical protein